MGNRLFLSYLVVCFSVMCSQKSYAVSGITPVVNYFQGDLKGSLSGPGGGNASLTGDQTGNLGFKLNLHILGFSSSLSYQPLSFQNNISVNQNFNFDGKAYLVGDSLKLDTDWNTWDWEYRLGHFGWDRKGTGGFDMKFLVGIQAIEAAMKLTGSRALAAAPTSQIEETVPLPYLGIAGNGKLTDNFRLEGSAKALDLSLAGNSVNTMDYSVGLRYFPTADHEMLGSFYFGYRSRSMDLRLREGKADEAGLDFSIDGLEASYQIHF